MKTLAGTWFSLALTGVSMASMAQSGDTTAYSAGANRLRIDVGYRWSTAPDIYRNDGPLNAMDPITGRSLSLALCYSRFSKSGLGLWIGVGYSRTPTSFALRLSGTESAELAGLGVHEEMGGIVSTTYAAIGVAFERAISKQIHLQFGFGPTSLFGKTGFVTDLVSNPNTASNSEEAAYLTYTTFANRVYPGFTARAGFIRRTRIGNDLMLSFIFQRTLSPHITGTALVLPGTQERTNGAFEQYFSYWELSLGYTLSCGKRKSVTQDK